MKNIMVIGDLMLDEYIHGSINRMSPEAPIPIVDLERIDYTLGGAGNVVTNLRQLDRDSKITIVGVVGEDEAGEKVLGLLDEAGVSTQTVSRVSDFNTTVKTRIVAGNKQIVRLDTQSNIDVSSDLISFPEDFDVIIFSDYDYGVINKDIIQTLVTTNAVTVADPKRKNFWNYGGVDIFKPNQKELWQGLTQKFTTQTLALNEISSDDVPVMLDELRRLMVCDKYLVTAGRDGMVSYDSISDRWTVVSSDALEVCDVTGAGDTVTAFLADCVAEGMDFANAVRIANSAAGMVVGDFGCSYVSEDQIRSLKNGYN